MTRPQRPPLAIRPAEARDLSFVLALVPRLVALDLPRWRDAEAIRRHSERLLREALEDPTEGTDVLVAEDANGPLGFVHVETVRDFFNGEEQGYVANLAIARAAEGRGVGRALMDAAEQWTRSRGMRRMSLYVFASNEHARGFYARVGYAEDSLKLVKVLED